MVKTKNTREAREIAQDVIVYILGGIALLSPWAVVLWYINQL